jgi:phosphatidylglycerophosphate synthase
MIVALPIGALLTRALLTGTPLDDGARWTIVGLGTLALVLDGVDGWVARRTGTTTPFGARFDMELDAALLLVLSMLAWRAGPVGAWVIGIGAMRYLFVGAGRLEPRLTADLPEDQLRRKTVCVLQGVALLVAVAPLGVSALQVGLAAATFGALVWSFGVDVAWLLRREPASDGPRRATHGAAATVDAEHKSL